MKTTSEERGYKAGGTVVTSCLICGNDKNHEIVYAIRVDGKQEQDDDEEYVPWMTWWDAHQILKCKGCDIISFRVESYFSEGDDEIVERRFPEPGENLRPMVLLNGITLSLVKIYRETVAAFNSGSFLLCAGGVRMMVESICLDQKVLDGPVMGKNGPAIGKDGKPMRKPDLFYKISGLAEKKVLTEDQANALHRHRILGNEAVHKMAAPTKEELSLAIDMLEQTIRQIYEQPLKAKELAELHKKRTKKKRQHFRIKRHIAP